MCSSPGEEAGSFRSGSGEVPEEPEKFAEHS